MPESRPMSVAYLAGTSYCGSTLMGLLMDLHPRVSSVGEVALTPNSRRNGAEAYLCSCGQAVAACPFWISIFRRVQQHGVPLSVNNWLHDYRYMNPTVNRVLGVYSDRSSVQRFHRLMTEMLPFHRQRVRTATFASVVFMQAILERAGTSVFFDTTKCLMRLSHLLQAQCLNIRVVRMVRDVRAFVSSSARLGESSVDQSATIWKRYQLAADQLLASLPKDKVFLLRYEDLCCEKDLWMRRLCDFLGVSTMTVPEEIDARQHHLLGNEMRRAGMIKVALNERWRSDLTRGEQDTALRVAGEINDRFGYSRPN